MPTHAPLSALAASDLVEGAFEDRNGRQILWTPSPTLQLDQGWKVDDAYATSIPDLELDGRGEELLVRLAVVDGPQAIEITMRGLEQLVPGAEQVALGRHEPPRIGAVRRAQSDQDTQEASDVFGRAAMNHVEIQGRHGRPLKHGSRHANDDELHVGGREHSERVSEARGCHSPPGWRAPTPHDPGGPAAAVRV